MNIKKFVSSVLLCVMTLTSAPALADDFSLMLPQAPALQPGEKDVGAALSPLKKGQVAPFTGVELSPLAVATIITELNSIADKVKIETDRARAEEQAKCDFKVSETQAKATADAKVAQAQLTDTKNQVNILTDQVAKLEKDKPNMPFWIGLSGIAGLLVGVGISVVTVFAIGAVK